MHTCYPRESLSLVTFDMFRSRKGRKAKLIGVKECFYRLPIPYDDPMLRLNENANLTRCFAVPAVDDRSRKCNWSLRGTIYDRTVPLRVNIGARPHATETKVA